jgi:hypothetical protein
VTSHFGLMVLFSFFVSAVFATLMRDTVADQLHLGGRLMGGFVLGGVVLGWLLYFLPL